MSLPYSSNLSVVQKWKISFATSEFRNSHFPEEYEKLPLPVVTDVNGDGKNDIIYVTTDFEIKISSSADIYEMGEEIADSSLVAFSQMRLFSNSKNSHLQLRLPELTATYTASLLPQFAITYGRNPVALAVGYIDPPGPVKRHQVIVVLTDGWVVMCFDHRLNLLWESHAVEFPNPSMFHKEAAILIDPTPLTNGDRGVIIVGGRKELIETSEKIIHEHVDQQDFQADPEELHKMKDEALDPPPPRPRIRNLKSIEGDDVEADLAEDEAQPNTEEQVLPEEYQQDDPNEGIPSEEQPAQIDAEDSNQKNEQTEDGGEEPAGNDSNEKEKTEEELDAKKLEEAATAAGRVDEKETNEKEKQEEELDAKKKLEEEKKQKVMERIREQARLQEELAKKLQESINNPKEEEDTAQEEENHFSYYAFEGHTGALKWRHEPGDFQDLGDTEANLQQAVDIFSQPSASAEAPDMALKLHLYHNLRHLGERDWSFFVDDMHEQLPFVWRTREDTALQSYYFDRQRNFGNPRKVDDSEEEYRTMFKRNVVVSRNSHGLEVLHLYSGRPLTRLELASESLFLDVNNDGVIDRVQSIPKKAKKVKKGGRGKVDSDTCIASAVSGVPTPLETLFEKSVCTSYSFSGFSLGLDNLKNAKGDNIDMANPTFTPAGFNRYNTVFLVSSGKVTSLSPEGEIVWQADTDATWSKADPSKTLGKNSRFGKVESFLEMGGFPSIQPFSLYGPPDLLVAVGYHTLSIVSAVSGVVEAEARLPSVPNGPVVTGDWDSDGDNDIIVPCVNGFVGLRITNGSGTPLYSILFGLIIIAIPILYFFNQPTKKRKPKKTTYNDNESLLM